ncbi:cyclin-like protein [Biscogniauxia marginata]|nr:cyclin-like protein [Biscogniauxia marginata]
MDAKPCRPARPLPNPGNENYVPPASKTVHQRHKSTGNLLSMAAPGGLNVAAKRNVLADVNRPSRSIADASTGTSKNSGIPTVAPIKDQENRKQTNTKDAFLRPALRPSKAGSIATSASMSTLRPVGETQVKSRPIAQARPKKQITTVYNDNQSTRGESEQVPNFAKPTIPSQSHTQQRAPSHQYAPVRPEQAPSGNYSRVRDPQPRDSKYAVFPLKDWTAQGTESTKPSDLQRAEEDITEALYLDAVEEIIQDEHRHQPSALEKGPLIPVNRLPEPIGVAKPIRTEVKSIEYRPDFLTTTTAEDQQELSDYDDEDYYDDQGYTTAHSNRSRGDNTTIGATTIMFPPKLTKRGLAEIEAAKELVESKRTDIDIEEDSWDVSMVAEYGDEIFQYMRELEMDLLPNAHYMDIQAEIKWSTRSVLMEWVVQVHTRFGLLAETLFLTVNYIDRFLSYKIVSLGKIQLVGATAILLAAKYEEINCPSVSEIVYMVDGGYTVDEVLKAERFMLSMLNFELGWPGPMSFLRRISKADEYDTETRTLSKYFLEVAIMDERFVASPPSYVAAGSHCLSRLILEKGDWSPAHVHYSGYTYNQLKPLIGMLLDCCRIARKHHKAVYRKYASDLRYKGASLFVEDRLAKGFNLPFQQSISYRTSGNMFEDDVVPTPCATTRALQMPIPG